MSYYEGTYIDRLPLELQDQLGVPVVVGRLLTLPVELLDIIFSPFRGATERINRAMRGYLVRKRALRWPNVLQRRRFNMRQARHIEASERYRYGRYQGPVWQVPPPFGV